ncbi:methyltransferase domain-containing protein, partial [Candidatus Bathyarchaeota archaeon]|nr:methyltransferase domain-containing protein [Candidatus Bathyarchaeota archaeon]
MNANTNDKDRQAKKTVQSRFDEFRKWSPNDVEKRFGTTPRRYIDQAEVKSVLDLLDLDQTHETLALDAGCGSGRFLIPLSKDLNIFGVDFSKGLLEKAKKESPRVSLCVADLEHLPFGTETFDTVLCIRVLQ